MPTCQNITRNAARVWWEYVSPKNYAWIQISEPEIPDSVISNSILGKLPNLKISFWDCTEVVQDVLGDFYLPPDPLHAAKILQFIQENRGKNFIINCKAGISRSGAICKFLEEYLDYEWINGKDRARPNSLLVELLKQEFDYFKESSSSNL